MIAQQTPTVTPTFPSDQDASGRTLGDEELALITQAIRSGCLFTVKGPFGKKLQTDFAKLLGVKHAIACSSGSAAIHTAVAAIDPEPGDEIVTTPITDMGALTPILYQGAIPVFADVDPRTGNVTPETIAQRISNRTRAIIVTHLFGNPCDMTGIMAVANERGIPVIEDCAQAFLATHRGKLVGTFGALGCFSLQQGKHITSGEGGLVVTNDDALARRAFLFVNKGWGYGDANPDHYFLAPNYRMSELQTACALAQLPKLPGVVAARVDAAAQMDELLTGTPGIQIPHRYHHDVHTYWKYSVLVDPEVIPGGPGAMAGSLKELNIVSTPRYIQKPAFRCQVLREQRTFGTSRWPFTLARPEAVDYNPDHFPGTFDYLDRVLVLPWNEKYTGEHLRYLAAAIYQSACRLVEGGAA
jgi:dTDP-4-amino-4,6-dideoxygalactose transaminase